MKVSTYGENHSKKKDVILKSNTYGCKKVKNLDN